VATIRRPPPHFTNSAQLYFSTNNKTIRQKLWGGNHNTMGNWRIWRKARRGETPAGLMGAENLYSFFFWLSFNGDYRQKCIIKSVIINLCVLSKSCKTGSFLRKVGIFSFYQKLFCLKQTTFFAFWRFSLSEHEGMLILVWWYLWLMRILFYKVTSVFIEGCLWCVVYLAMLSTYQCRLTYIYIYIYIYKHFFTV
jgi:hypothetical protein